MRSLCRAVAILFLLAAAYSAVPVVEAGKLYPKCGGKNYSLTIGHKHNYPANKVMDLGAIASAIEIECLAFEVVPPTVGPLAVTSGTAKDQCTREYFESENPFRIYLQAELMGKDGNGNGVLTRWDLDDVLGGSVDKLKYWNNGDSLWSVWFVNKDPKRCPMQVNMMLLSVPLKDPVHVHPSPGLVMVSPATVYVGTDTLLGFNVIGGPNDGDRVRMRPEYNPDRSHTWQELVREKDDKALARHKLYNAQETAAFKYVKPKGGNYLVEYMRDIDQTGQPAAAGSTDKKNRWVAIAHLIVYNGNPAYFKISKGGGPDGQLYVGRPTTFTFYGDKLNTQKHGDRVKFVNFTEQCGSKAKDWDHVGTSDLGPGDEPSTYQSDWTFKLKHGGAIRVCYKTKTGSWGEVVSYDDLDHLGPATNAPFGSLPQPTHAVSGAPCNMAPPSKNPTDAKTDVVLTLKGGDNFRHSMVTKLADLLCVDPKTIQIITVGTNSDHMTTVSIDIVCHKYGLHAQCKGTERKDMLLYMWSNQYLVKELKDLGIADVKSQLRGAQVDTVYTWEPQNMRAHHGHPIIAILMILLVLGAAFAFGWVFRDKIKGAATAGRGQFMQIGTVDDDDEDDDHNTPHGGTSAPSGTVGQRAARSINDSANSGDALAGRP